MTNVTFSQNSCSENSVSLSVPTEEISLHEECGQSTNMARKINVTAGHLKRGLLQIHLKMKDLASGGFTLNWEYD